MAKTYINTVKYEMSAHFEIDGIVDKHDIIGAIFGQSEGLLGEDMDLRELQKGGKIGRLEIKEKTHSGKTSGTVYLPSSLDRVQTALLAAAIESVDKVGPCDAKFEIDSIKDARVDRRKKIEERAKELLESLEKGIPETQVMTESVRTTLKKAGIVSYGKDKLPAGPTIESSKELIIVEGRADVLNLLKHSISNAIGMGGSNVPRTIANLTKEKTTTAFIDGDRGGELNLRKLAALAKVDFVARAPDGKEVEELTRKEIEAALRKKVPAAEFVKKIVGIGARGMRPSRPIATKTEYTLKRPERTGGEWKPSERIRRPIERPCNQSERLRKPSEGPLRKTFQAREVQEAIGTKEEIERFSTAMKELENSLKARFLDEKGKTLKEISVRSILEEMGKNKGVEAVVFDGIVTERLLEEAEKNKIKYLVGVKKGKIEKSENVRVIIIS